MAKLTYSMMQSLDGFIADAAGSIDWVQIDEEVHGFANQEAASCGIEIYGRRMYETMVAWETLGDQPDLPAVEQEFAVIWKRHQKIVISSTLQEVASGKTSIQRRFDPAIVRAIKLQSPADISVSGATLAAAFIEAGLVDEISTYIIPVVLGGGTPFFADVKRRLNLELVEERRFERGAVFLRYRVRN